MDGEISNIKKWIILYPIYINSKKTIAEGRRISTSKACENPTCAEIGDCCSHLKLPFAIEIDKAYARDFMQRGRVRVLLKKEDGTFSNPAISSRKQLMLRIAELVPRRTSWEDQETGACCCINLGCWTFKIWERWKKEEMASLVCVSSPLSIAAALLWG